ncbi:MAG: hypothetical protein ACRCWY_04390 [Cellulosilyticaceae bacterium]
MENLAVILDYNKGSTKRNDTEGQQQGDILEYQLNLVEYLKEGETIQEITKISLYVEGNVEGYMDTVYGKKMKVYNELYGRIECILEDTSYKVFQFRVPKVNTIPVPQKFNSHQKYNVETVVEHAFGQQLDKTKLYIGCYYYNYILD